MQFRNRIRNKLSINTINELVIDKDRRELKSIVIDILKTVTGVRLYGYRMTPVDPEEDFKSTNVDYLKKSKSQKSKFDIYIDMSDDVIDNLECWFLLSEDRVDAQTIAVSKANTKRDLYTLPKLEWEDENIKKEILSYDTSYLPTNDENTRENLFIKINLYVPRLINNTIRLNGNHYFNKFYIQDGISLTQAGKLKCQHPTYISYLTVKKVKDLDKEKEIEVFRTEIFGSSYNPFIFLRSLSDIPKDWKSTVLDFEDEEKRTYFDTVISNTLDEASKINPEDYDIDSVSEAIPPSDVLENIYRYIVAYVFGGTQETISLHTSLKSKLRIDMKRGLKITGKKSKRVKLHDYKERINLDPRTMCTIIKNNKQYTLTKSANEVDIYNFFGYVSSIEEIDAIAYDRNFRYDHLGIIDPIATSTSDNVGLAGLLVFSIPDVHLSQSEGSEL